MCCNEGVAVYLLAQRVQNWPWPEAEASKPCLNLISPMSDIDSLPSQVQLHCPLESPKVCGFNQQQVLSPVAVPSDRIPWDQAHIF